MTIHTRFVRVAAFVIALLSGATATHAYTVVARSQDVVVDCGSNGTSVPTDWYFPQPNDNLGLVWVQHGFSRANNHFEELSRRLAEQGYVVFATSLAPGSAGCAMNNAGFLSDFSRLFPDRHNPNVGLLKSAITAAAGAGLSLSDLPDSFAFTGHSAGAGSVMWAARKLIENHPSTAAKLVGLVLLDPVEGAGTSLIADATPYIADGGIPAHTISSPGYPCNSSANGTMAFVNAIGRPFAGVRLTSGSHCDAEASSSDLLCTAFCGNPQAENVSILQTLTKAWIADFFAGSITLTNYPGGSYYQSKIANGRIVTLPESNCGNGTVDSGEQCDDGNRFDGDCCSGACRYEVAGSACAADANSCTDDICNGSGSCTHPNNQDPCDDGDACTQSDACANGACVGTEPVVCSALDQCHDAGSCDPQTGVCSNPAKADGATCDDGDACTQTDRCIGGACGGADPVVCSALDQCHDAGSCDPQTGACSNPAKADGATCDDSDACTQTDRCISGACAGSDPVVCSALDQCHDAGSCDPQTGVCSNPAKADGATCDDRDACTQTDRCISGACAGSDPVVCSALDQCHDAGSCDPQTGVCSNPAKADGTTCDDSDACTQTDRCISGACAGSDPVVCGAPDQCHDAGSCDPQTGVCSNPAKADGTTCDDSDACTQTDRCVGGACGGSDPVVCSALDQCHDAGSCDPQTGVCSNPVKADGATCDDSDACTQTDRCVGGACGGSDPVVCSALDQCHDAGSCDPETGVCSNPTKADGATCDDGDACTLEECRSGVCLALATPCGDGVVDAQCGEQCDDGSENGGNSCCDSECVSVDSDSDGVCDRDDPCTGPAMLFRARARVRNLTSDRRPATLDFKGRAVLPFPFVPELDPVANGLRLRFGVAGSTWSDVQVPGGDFSSAVASGWRTNRRGDLWKYSDRTETPVGGIERVIVRDRSARDPGIVEVAVKAVVPGGPVAVEDLPLEVLVVFDVPVAMGGQCATSNFDGAEATCSLDRRGASLTCR